MKMLFSRFCCYLAVFASASPFQVTKQQQQQPESISSSSSTFSRFFLIILENKNQQDVLDDPYLGRDLKSRGLFLSDMHAIAHPSQPNYIAMITGDPHGINDDSSSTIAVPSLVDLLEAKNKTWKTYQEGYPSGTCYTGDRKGKYARKHNPFISIKNIQSDPKRCAKIVGAEKLQIDIDSKQVPDYVWYTPDLDNDGHDTSISYMSGAVKNLLEPMLANPYFKDTLFFLTFDENDGWRDRDNNKIYSLFLGSGVDGATKDGKAYNHYSILAFLEKEWGLGNLGLKDKTAAAFEF